MSIWGAVADRLGGYAGLSALVGSRIYAGHLPEDVALPAVSFSQVSETRFHNWGIDADVYQAAIQLDCWGSTVLQARQVSDQVIAALTRYSGTHDSTIIDDSRLLNRLGPLLELPEETIHRHYRFLIEFEVDHRG